MGEATRIVDRPRKDVPRLVELASRKGLGLVDFLADVVSRHPTYRAAADECGVSRVTFEAWLKRYGVRGK